MLWLLFLSLTGLVAASPVQPPIGGADPPKVLHYSTSIRRKPLQKRSAVKDSLVTDVQGLTIPLYVGSDLQEVPVWLDTGSWLSWVSAKNFNVNTSTTANKLETPFSIQYLGLNVSGWHWNDTFANTPNGDESVYIGFGIGDAGDLIDYYDSTGLLGLAENPVPGNDFIGQLQASGFIESRSYTFWLADRDHGSITFGGADLSKVTSEFTKLPSMGSNIYVQKFMGTLDGQEILFGEGNNFTCVLDSGTEGTYLPSGVGRTLMNAFGAVWTNDSPEAQAANMTADLYSIKYQGGGSLKYSSCGFEFEIPLWRYLSAAGSNESCSSDPEPDKWYDINIWWDSEDEFCLLGMGTVYMEYSIAFDIENQNIAFAKSNPEIKNDEGPSSLIAIGTGGIEGTFASSTELATLGTDSIIYSTASFTKV